MLRHHSHVYTKLLLTTLSLINTYIVFPTETVVVAASLTEHCRWCSNVVHYGEEAVAPAGCGQAGRAAVAVALPRWSGAGCSSND